MCFRIHSFLMSCEKRLSFMVYMYIITCKSVHGIKPLQCRECVVTQPRSQRSLLPVPKERGRERTWERGWLWPFLYLLQSVVGEPHQFSPFKRKSIKFFINKYIYN